MSLTSPITYRENGVNALILKIIAASAMLCDHIAVVFFDGQFVMRSIGRLAFPIFAFLIVEGFLHTRDVKKYAIRLFVFSLIAQIPYVLAFGDKLYYPNVIFTLFLGLIAIYSLDMSEGSVKWVIPLVLALLAEAIGSDHGAFGVMMIVLFYTYKPIKKKLLSVALLILLMQILVLISSQTYDAHSFIVLFYLMPLALLYFYNGKKGNGGRASKWVFYIFYPLHLTLIWVLSLIIT